MQALEHQYAAKSDKPLYWAGMMIAKIIAEESVMRVMFYIRYYVVPPASFGVFVMAEGLFLYGLYRAFVAP